MDFLPHTCIDFLFGLDFLGWSWTPEGFLLGFMLKVTFFVTADWGRFEMTFWNKIDPQNFFLEKNPTFPTWAPLITKVSMFLASHTVDNNGCCYLFFNISYLCWINFVSHKNLLVSPLPTWFTSQHKTRVVLESFVRRHRRWRLFMLSNHFTLTLI